MSEEALKYPLYAVEQPYARNKCVQGFAIPMSGGMTFRGRSRAGLLTRKTSARRADQKSHATAQISRIVGIRLLSLVPTVAAIVIVLVFLMTHLSPGDPAVRAAGGIDASAEGIAAARERLGLNDPLYVQFGRWFGKFRAI